MEITLASLTELISGIGSAMTWFWASVSGFSLVPKRPR